jgi:hypothetical protein
MDIGRIIREVEIVREVSPEPFPFEPGPVREPAPGPAPEETTSEPNRVP